MLAAREASLVNGSTPGRSIFGPGGCVSCGDVSAAEMYDISSLLLYGDVSAAEMYNISSLLSCGNVSAAESTCDISSLLSSGNISAASLLRLVVGPLLAMAPVNSPPSVSFAFDAG